MEPGKPSSNLRELRDAIAEDGVAPEIALKVLTSNPARILKLKKKGNIAAGMDADLLLLDAGWNIHDVFAMGVQVMARGKLLKKGAYED